MQDANAFCLSPVAGASAKQFGWVVEVFGGNDIFWICIAKKNFALLLK
jgi:hypothetical protein